MSLRVSKDGKKNTVSQPRRVVVGEDFNVKSALVSGNTANDDGITRKYIVYFVMFMCAIFLIGAAVLRFRDGNFGAVGHIWGVVGPI
jgi:hypothetical protein